MNAHEIHFAAKIKPPTPLTPPRGSIMWGNYVSPRRLLLKCGGLQQRGAAPTHAITNIVNNLRVINHIALRVFLRTDGLRLRGRLAPERAREVVAFAGAAIDLALRGEIDRELALMRRGENIGANRRRRAMLGHYLLTKPYQTIRHFYAARMQLVSPGSDPAAREEDGFHSDVIHERHIHTAHTTYEQHNMQVIRREGTPVQAQEESARRIAEQVFNRVERKMRLERERSGLIR